jgi:acetamidase/formamidase
MGAQDTPPTHVIEVERHSLHGRFNAELPPVLTIDPGDSVQLRTLDAGWRVSPDTAEGRGELFAPRDPEHDDGHCLSGPIAVRGAEPGMVLGVRIDEIRCGRWGVTGSGRLQAELPRRLGLERETALRWTLDPDRGTGVDQFGHGVRLSPFMGVMGMPPPGPGWHPTPPPRAWGGNIDCKELVAGSTIYLPVPVSGGLFSVGDGHALQADGEVSGTAIECPMERVVLTFSLHPDMTLPAPAADTGREWLTFGFHEDLDEAAARAVDGMLRHIGERWSIRREEALALCSLLVDIRVTQVVNGVKGVHAVLPHGAL